MFICTVNVQEESKKCQSSINNNNTGRDKMDFPGESIIYYIRCPRAVSTTLRQEEVKMSGENRNAEQQYLDRPMRESEIPGESTCIAIYSLQKPYSF